MKLKIYPKIRHLDAPKLAKAFLPRPNIAGFTRALAHLVEQVVFGDTKNYEDRLYKLEQDFGLRFSRDQWCAVRITDFVEYVEEWFGKHTFTVMGDHLEGELAEGELYRINGFDYQWFDEAESKWRSRKD